jgi:RimJ/RimL family protein N-acetyltransferase
MFIRSAKDGREFTIRTPTAKDAEHIIHYSSTLFLSTDQVLTMPEEYTITTAAEETWINNLTNNPNALVLIAELAHQTIGLLFFTAQTKKKNAHTGEFGVSVHPAYQAIGVGRALIETLIEWAKLHPRIEKLTLQVFTTNTHAIKLYRDLGFIEEGRHVKAIKQAGGQYIDILQMYLWLADSPDQKKPLPG